MATGPIIHHYVPRFLLRRFADPKTGQVWVYEKGTGRVWQCNPENVAAERRYYAFTGEDGKPNSTVEDAFSKLEGHAASIIERLERDKTLPTTTERPILAEFIAFSMLRGPSFRKRFERFQGEIAKRLSLMLAHHKEAFERTVKEVEQKTGQKFDVPTEEVRQAVLEGAFKYEGTLFSSLDMMLDLSPELAGVIHQMRWQLLYAPDGVSFITSDRHVVLANPKLRPHPIYGNPGLGQKDVLVFFPLRQKCSLFCRL
jgi:hypothetical protein